MKPDSFLIKTAKCKVLGFIVGPVLLFRPALSNEEDRVENRANEFLLPGRINELSHNSREENLNEGRQKEETGFYNNSSSFENVGIVKREQGRIITWAMQLQNI